MRHLFKTIAGAAWMVFGWWLCATLLSLLLNSASYLTDTQDFVIIFDRIFLGGCWVLFFFCPGLALWASR